MGLLKEFHVVLPKETVKLLGAEILLTQKVAERLRTLVSEINNFKMCRPEHFTEVRATFL